MALTREELDFLDSQGLTSEDVFDAKWLSREDAKEQAKILNKRIIIGSPCKKASHRLRTRAGHCCQCDTSKISFEKRYETNGYVYVSGSISLGMIKIGTTNDLSDRKRTLNTSSYAGTSDWTILLSFKTDNAGRIEKNIQKCLEEFATSQVYMKSSKEQQAEEIYRCSFSKAYEAINFVLGSYSIKPKEPFLLPPNRLEPYEKFKNIKGDGRRR